ncbi:hypothetical protein V1511DRAFT_513153 [Dipodascopsis uninucleata]
MVQKRTRGSVFGRPKSIVLDKGVIEELRIDSDSFERIKAGHHKKSSASGNSSHTTISICSSSFSTSSFSSGSIVSGVLEEVGIDDSHRGNLSSVLVPPTSPTRNADLRSDQRYGITIERHILSTTSLPVVTERPQKKDIFEKVKTTLDKRKKLPWSQSRMKNSELQEYGMSEDKDQVHSELEEQECMQSEAYLFESQPAENQLKNNLLSLRRGSADSQGSAGTLSRTYGSFKDHFSLRDMITRYHSNKSSSRLSSAIVTSSASSLKTPNDSTYSFISSPVSISSPVLSPTSPPSVMTCCPILESGEDSPCSSQKSEGLLSTPTPLNSVPILRSVPRSRRRSLTQRPQTIVGFFRQSRIFSQNKTVRVFELPLKEATILSRMSSDVDDERYWVPSLVTICIDFIDQYGLQEEGLYRISGSVTGIEELKRAFSLCSRDMILRPGVHDVHTVASFLKSYIRSIPEEIIKFTSKLSSLLARHNDCPHSHLREILGETPVYNLHLLRMLCKHFARVAANSRYNRMPLTNLILILCPTMRLDSKLFSWILEDVDETINHPHLDELIRSKHSIALLEERNDLIKAAGH